LQLAEQAQPWLFATDQIWQQYGITPLLKLDEKDVNTTAASISIVLTWFCDRWTVYNWPKVAFWTQEVLRRTEALPQDLAPQKQHELQRFVRKATYLMCVFEFDPQNGTEWSEHVADFMQQVRSAPDTSLDMPDLEGWFTEPPQSYLLFAADACMFWTTSNIYDLGYLARRLKGNKDLGDTVCWDTVPKQQYSLPFVNTSFDLGFSVIPSNKDFVHDEFLACQEHPLTQDILDSSCPMFGHYPKGMWGLPDNMINWGDMPEEGSETYNGVLECNAKLGVPEFAHLDYSDMFPYGDNIGIMETPEWKANATNALWNKLFGDVQGAIGDAIDDAVGDVQEAIVSAMPR